MFLFNCLTPNTLVWDQKTKKKQRLTWHTFCKVSVFPQIPHCAIKTPINNHPMIEYSCKISPHTHSLYVWMHLSHVPMLADTSIFSLPDCNSMSTIWRAQAACLLLILFTRLLYFTLCKSGQLFPSACMNQCFPGVCAGDCMRLNTSNLCFNYDDLLSVRSLACSGVHCIVHWISLSTWADGGFDCIHQIASNLDSADLRWWWRGMQLRDVGLFADTVKIGRILLRTLNNWSLQLLSYTERCVDFWEAAQNSR